MGVATPQNRSLGAGWSPLQPTVLGAKDLPRFEHDLDDDGLLEPSRLFASTRATVEMEAAAFFAVGRFRQVQVAQLLYAGDTLADDTWDGRNWVNARTVRELMFELALDAAASVTLEGNEMGG